MKDEPTILEAIILSILLIIVFLLCGCALQKKDIKNTPEYKMGYDTGYSKGYDDMFRAFKDYVNRRGDK